MKCFEMLVELQKPFTKVSQPATVEAADSQFVPLGENQNGL
jgi:biotin synthase